MPGVSRLETLFRAARVTVFRRDVTLFGPNVTLGGQPVTILSASDARIWAVTLSVDAAPASERSISATAPRKTDSNGEHNQNKGQNAHAERRPRCGGAGEAWPQARDAFGWPVTLFGWPVTLLDVHVTQTTG